MSLKPKPDPYGRFIPIGNRCLGYMWLSSDTAEDQLLKEQVVGMARRRLVYHGNYINRDYLGHVRRMLPSLEDEIENYLELFAPVSRYRWRLTGAVFLCEPIVHGKFPPGQYLALKIVLGGTGENWWCLLFPPLCVHWPRPSPMMNRLNLPAVGSRPWRKGETAIRRTGTPALQDFGMA